MKRMNFLSALFSAIIRLNNQLDIMKQEEKVL